MAPITAWKRLIRYVSAKDGSIKYGEPIVSEDKPDIDALAQKGGLKVKVLEGESPLLAKPTGEEDEVCARRGAPAERDSWCGLGRAGAPISASTAMNPRRLTWIESLAFRPGLGDYGRADRSLRGRCCRASLGLLLFGLFSFAIAALFTLRHSISLLGK